MIARLAKSTACFFVRNNLVDKEDEEVYAYGMELLLSTVFNLIIALFIAIVTDTFIPCLINLTSFVTIRIYAGGYHADTHIGCMTTLAIVQSLFVAIIKMTPVKVIQISTPFMLVASILLIVILAPVAHPNKPLSERLKVKLRKKAYISTLVWTAFTLAFLVLGKVYISFCSAYGMLTVSIAMTAEIIKLRRKEFEEELTVLP